MKCHMDMYTYYAIIKIKKNILENFYNYTAQSCSQLCSVPLNMLLDKPARV